ncbi:MAG: dTDP-4-dehydrorhamnose reductase [Arenicella sp.]|nr:dTDP-4-dehydrorhamnose reductase [Arenicella sp.]
MIGQNGQVTTYLQSAFKGDETLKGLELYVAGRDVLDLADVAGIETVLEDISADMIINPAAYTAVDLAEQEADAAFTINRDAVAAIAAYCAKTNTPLIHFSTDYVFAGDANEAYLESDETIPNGIYGQSKLEGENAILASGAPAIILRTAWVYSNHGKNFYKTMLSLAASRDQLSVVGDQVGAPTYAGSIADATKQLVALIFEQGSISAGQSGVYHFSCQGQTSWAEFAKAIFVENEITDIKVNSIRTEEYPTPAKRPAFSVLNGEKLKQTFDISLPHWGTALAHCAAEIKVR